MCDAVPCRCSCELQQVHNLSSNCPVGSFLYRDTSDDLMHYRSLWVKLPLNGGQWHALPLYRQGQPKLPFTDGRASWEWDGNEAKPTLFPSVLCYTRDQQTGWHGFISAGRAQSC